MSWQPNADQTELFAPAKQRSAAFTLARRALRSALCAWAETLPGSWDCTPAEPCLANARKVQNLVLFNYPFGTEEGDEGIDLASPFALDVLPFHDHLCRFVRIDQAGFTWGLLLHQKAALDRRNLAAFLTAFEGAKAFDSILSELDDAASATDVEGPTPGAAQRLPTAETSRGWCLWWSADAALVTADLNDRISRDLERLSGLIEAIAWREDNDLCGAIAERKARRSEQRASRFRKGDRVRITSGLFAGRIGRVQQRHDGGLVSLGVGPMTIQVADSELSPL
jgi:hypothetical protein